MTSNIALIEVKDRGWLNGFANLLRKENHRFWGTRTWLIQTIIWTALAAFTMFDSASSVKAGGVQVIPPFDRFFVLLAIGTTLGTVILGQDALIDERKFGTAAWVLTKPVSRAAFMLSKLGAYALGIFVAMVLVPGLTSFFIFKFVAGFSLYIPSFCAAMGLLYLMLLYFLMLTFMLGSLFHSRGPVIGIPLMLVFSVNAASTAAMRVVLPWSFVMASAGKPGIAIALTQGQPLTETMPIISVAVQAILFTIIAMVRFYREEF
jgi:ABC-2 type transport system permease protein